MIRTLLFTAVAAVFACASPAAPQPAAGDAAWSGVDRIVVFGDLHGDLEKFDAMLRQARLVNNRGDWVGGDAHLVQLGDIPDRGDGTRTILDRLMKLERQAARAGGRVHALIGNHEAMNVGGDLRYVTAGEFAAFATRNSKQSRRRYYDRVIEHLRDNPPAEGPVVIDDAFKTAWEAEHPLGWVEHRLAWAATGAYGGWVAGHDAMVKINDTLFVHAGVSPAYAGRGRADINAEVRAALTGAPQDIAAADILWADDSPLWYRGFAYNAEAAERANLDAVLARHGVERIVVGHTPVAPGIVPRFGGDVILADVFEPDDMQDPRSFLVIENGVLTVVHRGRAVLMNAGTADGVAAYLTATAALDPDPSRFPEFVARNEADAAARLAAEASDIESGGAAAE